MNFLTHHHYGLLQGEVGLLLVAVLGSGMALGLLLVVSPHVVRVLLLATLLALCSDALLGRGPLHVVLPLYLVCYLVSLWLTRDHATEIVAFSFLVLIASIFVLPGEGELQSGYKVRSNLSRQADLPPLIHIVLDEHIGIEGIPTDVPGGGLLKEELKGFYAENDFKLYAGAYSQYFQTRDSIPNLFNFSSSDTSYRNHRAGSTYVLEKNRYFQLLAERGYVFRIYQSNYIDYCQDADLNIASCFSHSYNSINDIQALPIASVEKARFIFFSLMDTSRTAREIRDFYNKIQGWLGERNVDLPHWYAGAIRVGPIPALSAFEHMRQDVVEGAQGTVFFAHLALPHFPYVYRSDCQVREKVSDWLNWSSEDAPGSLSNTSASRATRYERYFEQIQCQQAMLRTLFADLRRAGIFDEALIILHGDHGSRILEHRPNEQNRDVLTATDYVDAYSTLFAVKWPGIGPDYDTGAAPLQLLLSSLFDEPVDISAPRHVYLEAYGHAMPREPMAPIGMGR